MSTSPSPLTQTTPRKTSVKAPLILLGITFGILMFGVQWMRSLAQSTSPIYHQTKSGWQQFPTPAGFSRKDSSLERWHDLAAHLGKDCSKPLGRIQVEIDQGHKSRNQNHLP